MVISDPSFIFLSYKIVPSKPEENLLFLHLDSGLSKARCLHILLEGLVKVLYAFIFLCLLGFVLISHHFHHAQSPSLSRHRDTHGGVMRPPVSRECGNLVPIGRGVPFQAPCPND